MGREERTRTQRPRGGAQVPGVGREAPPRFSDPGITRGLVAGSRLKLTQYLLFRTTGANAPAVPGGAI